VIAVLNVETVAQFFGWDTILLSLHASIMPDIVSQTWVIVAAAFFVGAATGAWVHHLLPPPKDARVKDSDVWQGPVAPKAVYSTDWAQGISIMPIQEVACALCGIEPQGFATLARAKALADDLVGAVSAGWVCSEDARLYLIDRRDRYTVRIVGRPAFPGTEDVTFQTRIYTPSLLEDYAKNHEKLDTSWIPAPKNVSPSVTVEGP